MAQDSITYEELADPKWKGKICIRSGQHTYNVALVASMIANHGEEKAEAWLTGLRDNLATQARGRRSRGGARRAGRALRPRHRQHLLHGGDAQEPRAEAVGRCGENALSQRRRPRHARQRLGRRARRARTEPGQRRQAASSSSSRPRRRSSMPRRTASIRSSRASTNPSSSRAGASSRPILCRSKDRRASEEGLRADRQGALRRRPELLSRARLA